MPNSFFRELTSGLFCSNLLLKYLSTLDWQNWSRRTSLKSSLGLGYGEFFLEGFLLASAWGEKHLKRFGLYSRASVPIILVTYLLCWMLWESWEIILVLVEDISCCFLLGSTLGMNFFFSIVGALTREMVCLPLALTGTASWPAVVRSVESYLWIMSSSSMRFPYSQKLLATKALL